MKRLLICITMILLFPGTLPAGSAAPTDRELFEDLYSQSLRALIPELSPGESKELLPVYAGGITLSESARSVTDAVLSALGYSIPDTLRESSRTLTIRITDARCTVSKEGKEYERFLSLTLHVCCTDRSGMVIYARGIERTAHDFIPRALRKGTDTGSRFSPEMKRIVLDRKPHVARIASLIALSAALGFFAFKK